MMERWLRNVSAAPAFVRAVNASARAAALRALKDETMHHILDDSGAVMHVGKGQFMLSFAQHVQSVGYWPAVRSVVHGNAKDGSSNGPAARYANGSLSFVYMDRCRRGRTVEMALFWPKLRRGGRMCGDDVGVKGVRPKLHQFFSKTLPKMREPRTTWEVTRESVDHWCATRL